MAPPPPPISRRLSRWVSRRARRARWARRRLGPLLVPALAACAASPVRYASVVPPTAQAVSLLGDTLWTPPLDPAEGQRRVRELFRVREQARRKPHDVGTQILLALSHANLGRLREAIAVCTEAIAVEPGDPRLPRRRGEFLLRIRELDAAEEDLARATRLALPRGVEPEFNLTPDGGHLVRGTLQYASLFYLGMTHYVKGAFPRARDVLEEARQRASTADEVAQSTFWLFLSTRRLGMDSLALGLLEQVPSDLPVDLAAPEYRLLLAYRGALPADSIPVPATIREPAEAVYGYGIGFRLVMLGREAEAALVLSRVAGTPEWTGLAVLAAESELARLRAGH